MTNLRLVFPALAISLVTAFSGAALADLAPPEACTSNMAGMPCNNAGPNNDQPGVCTSTTCPHTSFSPDGGSMVTNVPCVLCEEEGSSSSGTGGSTSSGGTPAGGGSCAVGTAGSERMVAGATVLAGLAALFAGRRRRRA
jgi:MYXO-CTERM domain-containing protein